jgi:hypothetical protein
VSAPVTERGKVGARTATIPLQRGGSGEKSAGRPTPPGEQKGQKGRQQSARRAYARRDDRLRRLVGGRQVRTSGQTGRAQFVLLIMALLAIGLVATLWFSTAAAADSYRLQDARTEALALSQQAERLQREVAVLESAPELARRATDLGMVQVQDPARLLVTPDGRVLVVGEPRAAVPPPSPTPPAAPPATGADPGQAGTAPDAGQPDGTGQDPAASDPGSTDPDSADPDSTDLASDEVGGRPGEDGTVVAQGAHEDDPAARPADGASGPQGRSGTAGESGAAAQAGQSQAGAGDAGAAGDADAPQGAGTGEG